jgi:transposase
MRKHQSAGLFKSYSPNQILLLPPSLEELIEAEHPVRVVNDVIERIDLQPLLEKYPGGGSSSFHPKMLLKAMVFANINNLYSSRKIEAAIKENIYYMWLCGMQKPDHNTINRFRTDRLKDSLKTIFTQIVLMLADQGLLKLEEVYTDGTKIEANANRYTFVWGKAIRTNKEKMKKQLDELWQYAQRVAAEELKDTEPVSFEKMDAKKVEQTIATIDAALKEKPVSKKVKQKLQYAKKNWSQNLNKYQHQEKILEQRNSYSKTDTDATFMRMKEDHMRNGQLKPGFNAQLSTNNQFIVNYTLHPNPTDTLTLAAHLDEHHRCYGKFPEVITADSGYGSEQNYEYLEQRGIQGYVKYNYFHKEQTKKYQQDPFRQNNLYYNAGQDCFYCPMGQRMDKIAEYKTKNASGYQQTVSRYEAKNCEGCPLRSLCHKAKGNRIIEVNHRLGKYKQQAREKLLSEEGIHHRKQRPQDVEAAIGNIKQNKGFRRFLLRGKHKIAVELGLICLAHNLKKAYTIKQKNKAA